ncbi:MAG: hypothetical protein JWP81_2466 [Ferruginibacter sp.]|nr:hypothetical protein [Ferruginibacter sp.]
MAQQKGILKIKGTMNDMTFYKTADGYLVKEKSEISKEKISNDPAFVRTRENNSEFGRAGKASKLLLNAIRVPVQNARDGRVFSRLMKEMMRVIKADATSTRGLRNVIDGETELLRDFDFNATAKLAATLYAPFTALIDRVTGVLSIDLPVYYPLSMIAAPAGSTHYKINSSGCVIDFTREVYTTVDFETTYLPIDGVLTAALNITHQLPANSTDPLFLFLGIQFFQQVNGAQYALRNGAFNALNIVLVEGV